MAHGVQRGGGLRVRLRRIDGLTSKKVLRTRDAYYFQCGPLEEFAVDHAHSFSDYDTISRGQYSWKGGRQLRQVAFDTLAVDWGNFVIEHHFDVEDMVEDLEAILNEGTPFDLLVTHNYASGPVELHMAATLRTLRVSERAGEPDARYLSVSFVEYREPVVSRKGKKRRRRSGRLYPVTHELGPTDTFRSLSKRYYKHVHGARVIANYNGVRDWGMHTPIVDHPRFRPLSKITIPRPPTGVESAAAGGGQ